MTFRSGHCRVLGDVSFTPAKQTFSVSVGMFQRCQNQKSLLPYSIFGGSV